MSAGELELDPQKLRVLREHWRDVMSDLREGTTRLADAPTGGFAPHLQGLAATVQQRWVSAGWSAKREAEDRADAVGTTADLVQTSDARVAVALDTTRDRIEHRGHR